jgi:hypothetical protein
MFFQKKPATEKVTYETVKKELDALIGKAEVAINKHVLVDLLESRVMALRCKLATSYSVAPRMHSGNL